MFSACSWSPGLWISLLLFPTRRESVPLESGKLRQEPVEIVCRPSVQMAGVEEIGIGDDCRRAFADPAVRDQPIGGDVAAAVERTRRRGENVIAAELSWLEPALLGSVEAQAPMAEQPRIHEHWRRTQRIAERAAARPFKHWIGEEDDSSASTHPFVQRDQIF